VSVFSTEAVKSFICKMSQQQHYVNKNSKHVPPKIDNQEYTVYKVAP